VQQLAEAVLRLTKSNSKIDRRPLPVDDPKVRQPDLTIARSVLNWEPKVPLEEGLVKTIAYFRDLLAA
jgi:nucleoside-diphosphate-sugar epimerase